MRAWLGCDGPGWSDALERGSVPGKRRKIWLKATAAAAESLEAVWLSRLLPLLLSLAVLTPAFFVAGASYVLSPQVGRVAR